MDCVCYGYVRPAEEMDMTIVVFTFTQSLDDVWYISLLIVHVIGLYAACSNSAYNLTSELQHSEIYFDCNNILLFKIFFSFQPCMMKISEFHYHQKVLISSIYQYNYVKDIYQYIYCFYTFHHTITLKICTDIHV